MRHTNHILFALGCARGGFVRRANGVRRCSKLPERMDDGGRTVSVMTRPLLMVVCIALGGCSFVMRDLLHMPLPLAEVDAATPHANVEIIVTHTRQISAHVGDTVRYAGLHGGPSGVLPTPDTETKDNKEGWDKTLRAPVGDGYWLVETEFFHRVTTRVCRAKDNLSCTTYEDHVRDAKCGAGGNFRFEDGHSYLLEYRFEGHARCALLCTERRKVDGVTVSQACNEPEKT